MRREQSMERLLIGGYKVDIIDEPQKTLTKTELDQLGIAAIPVVRKGFGNDGITESDIRTHALDVDTGIYIRAGDGELVGFGGSGLEEVDGKSVVHLKGAAILPEYQGLGLYNILTPLRAVREAEKNGPEVYVGTRTQNPRVFEYMTGKLGLHPQTDSEPDEDLESLAASYAQLVYDEHSDFRSQGGVGFDKDTFVVKRAYGFIDAQGLERGFSMYNDIPHAKDKRIEDYLHSNLDFNNGDAMILVGRYDEERYAATYQRGLERLKRG